MLKKMIYQSFWQMVFPVLRINVVAETLVAFMTFQGKDIPHLYMALGLKSSKKKLKEEIQARNTEAGVEACKWRSLLP